MPRSKVLEFHVLIVEENLERPRQKDTSLTARKSINIQVEEIITGESLKRRGGDIDRLYDLFL